MKDKNTFIGLFLIGILLIGFSYYQSLQKPDKLSTQTSTSESNASPSKLDTIPTNVREESYIQNATEDHPDSSIIQEQNKALQTQYGSFAPFTSGEEKLITLENQVIKLTFNTKGGTIHQAELKKYKTYDSLPVLLFDGVHNQMGYHFIAENRNIHTPELFFTVSEQNDKRITFRVELSKNKYLEQSYTLSEKSYDLDYDLSLVGFNEIIPTNINYINFLWKNKLKSFEKSVENASNNSTVYYKYANEDVDYLSKRGEEEEEKLSTKIDWVSFKQQFFNTTLIAQNQFDEGIVKYNTIENDSRYLKDVSASLTIPYSGEARFSFPMQFYLGPNHYKTLKTHDNGMDQLIPLGWGIFGWVNKYLIIEIFTFLNGFISNYGLIIFLLTLIIKLALFPLTYRSYVSTAKMKVLQPEIAEIKKKHEKDAQKMNTETMKLYGQAGVNPLGGCLPMVLQMPFLFAMYQFFPSSIELRQESFLWAEDLSSYDSILDLPFTLPFYGDHVSLFTLLMTVTTFLSIQMNSQAAAANPQMKIMQYVMPIVFLPMFNGLASGLTYYYFLANLITFIQQTVIKKFIINEDAIHQKIQANKKKPKKTSGFQKRLEDLAKARQAQMQDRGKKRK